MSSADKTKEIRRLQDKINHQNTSVALQASVIGKLNDNIKELERRVKNRNETIEDRGQLIANRDNEIKRIQNESNRRLGKIIFFEEQIDRIIEKFVIG